MTADLILLTVIVNLGQGSRALKIARECGASGGTALLGRGTVKNKLLEFLDLNDVRKEICYFVCETEKGLKIAEKLNETFKFEKKNHGIAFLIRVRNFFESREHFFNNDKNEGADTIMYNSITVIVEKGKGEEVMDIATDAGARGGTIINARGSGIHEKSKLFAMEIEPEKEIVLILSRIENTESIVESINEKMEIDKPGNGIVFIQSVDKTYGIY